MRSSKVFIFDYNKWFPTFLSVPCASIALNNSNEELDILLSAVKLKFSMFCLNDFVLF